MATALLALLSPLTSSQSRAKPVEPLAMRSAIFLAILSPLGLSQGAARWYPSRATSGPPLATSSLAHSSPCPLGGEVEKSILSTEQPARISTSRSIELVQTGVRSVDPSQSR